MTDSSENRQDRFMVVVNHEEQYSIWQEGLDIPQGWRAVGTQGTREECLAYIREVWTDMRPLSLKRIMEARAVDDDTSG